MFHTLFLTTALLSGDPAATDLPAPRQLLPGQVVEPPIAIPTGYYRESAYAAWDNYAVDRHGQFRTLVINSPCGAYYRYNGQPYGLMPVNQLNIIPKVAGTPYR